jgi:hypothetical protein
MFHEQEGMEMKRTALAMAFTLLASAVDCAQAAKPIYRPDYIEYVCGIKGGQPKTYLNVYFARSDGATQIRPGRCEAQQYIVRESGSPTALYGLASAGERWLRRFAQFGQNEAGETR